MRWLKKKMIEKEREKKRGFRVFKERKPISPNGCLESEFHPSFFTRISR